MSTLEIVIEKIQHVSPEQLEKIIEYIEFLEFQNIKKIQQDPLSEKQNFFALAGIWEGKNITTEDIRRDAWGEENQ